MQVNGHYFLMENQCNIEIVLNNRLGRRQSEPFESVFTIIKHFDKHAPVYRDGFAQPARVNQRRFTDIRKLGVAGLAFPQVSYNFPGR
jgi:hypothetical protein